MYMCVYIYICIRVCAYMYACMQIYVGVCICTYIDKYIYVKGADAKLGIFLYNNKRLYYEKNISMIIFFK